MAKINNSAVVQKLIDELELSPAKDLIPTELADKILPVFQVNSETLEIQMKPKYKLWQDAALNNADKTLTVPDGHTYILKYGMINYTASADVGSRMLKLEVKDAAGNIIWYVLFAAEMAATDQEFFRVSALDYKSQAGLGDSVHVPIPHEFVLKEGYTLQVVEINGTALLADDMIVSFMVDDQAD